MTEKTYRIFHNYDRGDQSVYLASPNDPTRAAIYCQFLAEDQLDESVSVLNIGIAKALVQFYDCTPVEKTDSAIDIDLYFAREGLCGDYEQLMADKSLQREGIIDLIRPYTHGVGDGLNSTVAVAADPKDLLGMPPATAEAILSNCRVQIELAPKTDQQQETDRFKLNRAYFEDGCACIHQSKTLQLCPTNMTDAQSVEFYEQHCKCSRNYVQS